MDGSTLKEKKEEKEDFARKNVFHSFSICNL